MNKKLFLTVLMLCVSLHSGHVFCSQKPTMGWREYLLGGWWLPSRGVGHVTPQQEGEEEGAYEARRAEAAKERIAPTLARRIQLKLRTQPEPVSVVGQETQNRRLAKNVARDFFGNVARTHIFFGGLSGLATAINVLVNGNLLFDVPNIGSVDSESVYVGILAMSSLVASFIINHILAQVGQGYIAEDNAVSLVKGSIAQMFSNSSEWPTRSSKIRALLKKNEWYIPLQKEGGFSEKQAIEIMDRACSELSQEIWNVEINDEQKKKDKEIDSLMQQIRMELQGKTLDEQIKSVELNQKRGTLTELLSDLEAQARHAVLSGLVKQKFVEKAEAESLKAQQAEVEAQRARMTLEDIEQGMAPLPQSTFEKTSAAKFYQPISEENQKAIDERKKMTPKEWETYREGKRAEEEAAEAVRARRKVW